MNCPLSSPVHPFFYLSYSYNIGRAYVIFFFEDPCGSKSRNAKLRAETGTTSTYEINEEYLVIQTTTSYVARYKIDGNKIEPQKADLKLKNDDSKAPENNE